MTILLNRHPRPPSPPAFDRCLDAVDLIEGHYYKRHVTINPTGIVPVGPKIDFSASHGRE